MPRYIDADALLRNTIYNPSHVPYITESDIIFAPTADVVPVKPGKWIKIKEDYDIDDPLVGRCSVCGWSAGMDEADIVGMNYCPNCGAYMGGVKK